MSETLGSDADSTAVWRVRKAPDDAIYGPVELSVLKEWANSAQVAPQDWVDQSDENWRLAPEVEFLEMLWIVHLPGEEIYGPTTIGTLREFIHERLITEKSVATHVKTNQSLPIGALFAALEFEKKRAMKRPPKEGMKSTASLAVDMAKDQRIRQLEEDLRNLRRDHEALLHRHRQMQLEMQAVPKIVQQGSKTGRFRDR